jgi:GH3 auxin-responsive promoter
MTSSMTEMSEHARLSGGASSHLDHGAARAAGEAASARGHLGAARSLVASPYPRLVGRAARHYAGVQVALWDHATEHLRRTQEKTLLSLVRHAKGTDFGLAHDFAGIRGYDDFADRVEIGDYDSYSPFIDRMRAGERNLLVPEFIRYFGNSSGSSNHGRPKFLPIGDRQIRWQQRAGADTLMRYLRWSGDVDLLSGFTLGLFPPTTMRSEGAVLITSNPALMMTKMPLASRPVYLPENDIRTIPSYDDKLQAIAERYVDHDVRAIVGTTCWFTLLFEKVLAVARSQGRPAASVSQVWPNLRVLFGGGVAAAPYLPVIRDFMGRGDVTLVDTYNATEGGVYAASDFRGAPGLLMLPHRGTFFEFVPLEDRGSASVRRVPLWGVEQGRLYSIVVTTASGLYAYELGDIVTFPSISPPRIEFAGRLSGCLSLTQELTTHVEIERAVEHARLACPCTTVDFGAAADVGVDGSAKSRYLLFVEFQEGAAPHDLDAFSAAFDEGLCKQNRVYREHRAGAVALLEPRVVPLVSGGARLFLEEVTRGNVQGKFPRVIDDTKKQLLWDRAARVR